MGYSKKQAGIYMILNRVSGKSYIGSSLSMDGRLYTHRYKLNRGSHFNRHLQAAWNKDGEASFSFLIVEEIKADISREKLKYIEGLYMRKFRTMDPLFGYNKYDPNLEKSIIDSFRCKDIKERKSIAMKMRWKDPEYRQKQLKSLQSKERRKKCSDRMSGEGNPFFGKHSPTFGRPVPLERRKKIGDALRGKKKTHTEAYKRKKGLVGQ